jgi:hypothetical protein
MRKRPLAERFWEKVNKDGPTMRTELGPCWVWTANGNAQGYGLIAVSPRKGRGAHRVAWFLAYGEWPLLDVLHHCDNPPCVRVGHLYLGDDARNVKDRKERGREGNHKGTANGRAKLTEQKAREIRELYKSGVTPTQIAANYGVSLAAVWFVIQRRTWKHA